MIISLNQNKKCISPIGDCCGFNLLEILLAMSIFFMCYFSIAQLLNTNLRAARSLNVTPVDFTAVVYDLLITNQLEFLPLLRLFKKEILLHKELMTSWKPVLKLGQWRLSAVHLW